MEMNINGVIADFTQKLKKDSEVLGVMLFGSVAQGTADRFSDIDIYVLLRKKKAYSRLNFKIGRTRIDALSDSLEDAQKYLQNERGNVRRPTSDMLAHGHILFDRSGKLKKLQKIALKNLDERTVLRRNEQLMHLYSIDDFWGDTRRDFEKENWTAFGWDSQLLIQNIVELFLKKKGLHLSQPKHIRKFLSKADPRFARLVESVYGSQSVKNRLRSLNRLVKYAAEHLGLMPDKWKIR